MLELRERSDTLETWPLARLTPNPLNPRGPVDPASVEELAASMRSQGILQPLLITPAGVIVAGHRRHAAATIAGLAEAPVVIRELTETEQLELMLVENLQRADLTAVQEARAYQQLLDKGLSQGDVVRQVGVSIGRVRSRLALLRLEPAVQDMFDRGELPLQAAPVLARVIEPHQQGRLALMVARRRMTLEALQEVVDRGEGIRIAPKGSFPKLARRAEPEPEDEEEGSGGPKIARSEALAILDARPGQALTFEDLRAQFDSVCGICGDCGMSSLEDICRECPLPQLAKRLGERWS